MTIGYLLEWLFSRSVEKSTRCAGVVSFPRSSIHPRGDNRQPASQFVPSPGGPATGGLPLHTSNQILREGRPCFIWLINGFDELLRCVCFQVIMKLLLCSEVKIIICCSLLRDPWYNDVPYYVQACQLPGPSSADMNRRRGFACTYLCNLRRVSLSCVRAL